MKKIANLLFEAKILKEIPRSGYHFLGVGKESVAEHSFSTTFIAYVMSRLRPETDALKLITMCLIHDLPEARTGDLNAVHKQYVAADDAKALKDATGGLFFGNQMTALIEEFEAGVTTEARLARDADQLALILELKELIEIGYDPPKTWIQNVIDRLQTETGQKIAAAVMQTGRDDWWLAAIPKDK
ncbi:MAG: HD domain-containing protein [Deltaproteobacteria bacterium]|jgi:5'-deoxynucleotidase YfbR-like HD superfamily hydrolase|nr:HD domain-containing protein [Deltaproteobacteria bacterium]